MYISDLNGWMVSRRMMQFVRQSSRPTISTILAFANDMVLPCICLPVAEHQIHPFYHAFVQKARMPNMWAIVAIMPHVGGVFVKSALFISTQRR